MKYLCLVYLDERRLDELPDGDCLEYDEATRRSGHCIVSEAIRLASDIPPARAGSIEVRPIRPIRETAQAQSQQRAP